MESQWVVSVPTCDIGDENKLNDDDSVTEIGWGEASKLCAGVKKRGCELAPEPCVGTPLLAACDGSIEGLPIVVPLVFRVSAAAATGSRLRGGVEKRGCELVAESSEGTTLQAMCGGATCG